VVSGEEVTDEGSEDYGLTQWGRWGSLSVNDEWYVDGGFSRVQLILCAELRDEKVGSCGDYRREDGVVGEVIRYRRVVALTVRVARTGDVIKSHTIKGKAPTGCPDTLTLSVGSWGLYGDYVSGDVVDEYARAVSRQQPKPTPTPKPTPKPTPTPDARARQETYEMMVRASSSWRADHPVSLEQEDQFTEIAESMPMSVADSDRWDLLAVQDRSFAMDSALALCEWTRTDVSMKEAYERLEAVVATRTDDSEEAVSLSIWSVYGSKQVFCPEYADVLDHIWE
jgi:hypothetical protein